MKRITALLIAFILFALFAITAHAFDNHEIPSSLEEAFATLDEMLEPEEIEIIKNMEKEDLILLHFGLGMGIRNFWLRPENSPMLEAMKELYRFGHLDNMSHFILTSYYYYLNGDVYTIEAYEAELQVLREQRQKEHTEAMKLWVILVSMFIAIIAAVRIFLRKLPRLDKFLEKFGRPKLLRVTYVLVILTLLTRITEWIYTVTWTSYVEIYVIYAVSALAIALSSLFFFTDMTRKQIALSAGIAIIAFVLYFMGDYYLGLYADFIEDSEILSALRQPVHYFAYHYDYGRLTEIFALFPLIFILLARSKKSTKKKDG